MSINSIISTAFTGLQASQAALRTTSNNIANVNVPGYARQIVQLESLVAGSQGAGVKVGEIQRVADRFLELSVYEASSDGARFDALANFHSRLQGLIGRPDSENNLGSRLDAAFQAVSDLALDTTDMVRRQGALAAIGSFAAETSRLADAIQDLRNDASEQITETVNSINQILSRISALNPAIVQAKVTNGELGPLQQQRAQALSELAELIDIKPVELPDGSVTVSTATGLTLLDNALRQLEYISPGTATAATNFPHLSLNVIGPSSGQPTGVSQVLDGEVASGRLRGLLDLRDRELPAIADNLGELARVFTDQMNAAHNANSSVPAPLSMTGNNVGLLTSDRLGFTGITDFAVVNASGALVAKTSIDFAALGPAATINDLIIAVNAGLGGNATLAMTGGVMRFTAAAGLGVAVADDPASPSDRAGRGFSHFFGLNDLVTAQQPSHHDTGVIGSDGHGFTAGETMRIELRDSDNRTITGYTLTVAGASFDDLLTDLNANGALGKFATFSLDANGALVMTPKPGFDALDVRVISDTTNRGGTGVTLSSLFGMQQGALADSAKNLAVAPAVAADPMRMALAQFDRTVVLGTRAIGLGDSRGAQALADLQLSASSFQRAGSLTAVTTSLSQYAAFVLGDTAIRASSAANAAEDSGALLADVTQRRDDFSGVNLDEELANMVVFQNAYSASARMLTTARDLYDTLLQLV